MLGWGGGSDREWIVVGGGSYVGGSHCVLAVGGGGGYVGGIDRGWIL
jgi:hypothetical protein